ncbi:MAG: hypothetical protein WEB04_08760 [Dehalococcoidia bacterium]
MRSRSVLKRGLAGTAAALVALGPFGLRQGLPAEAETAADDVDKECVLTSSPVAMSLYNEESFALVRTVIDKDCNVERTAYNADEAIAAGLITAEEVAQKEAEVRDLAFGVMPTHEELGIASSVGCSLTCPQGPFVKVENQLWDDIPIIGFSPFKLTWVDSWTSWAYNSSTKSVTNFWGGNCDADRAPDGWSLYDGPHCYYLDETLPRFQIEHVGAANFRLNLPGGGTAYDHFQEAWAIGNGVGEGRSYCDQYGSVPGGHEFRCVRVSFVP